MGTWKHASKNIQNIENEVWAGYIFVDLAHEYINYMTSVTSVT